ncbi:MAG: Gfo/Idh/MocA family oxidoreductase [Gemmataceae bacterium]|nr:Gfo/Idh/MocA family oxidoreductase [Gemmataceae bacterium]
MVRIGLAGIGFMGMIHYLGSQRVKGAKVTALSSRDEKKLSGDWRGIQGNFGPPGAKMNLNKIKKYQRYEDMLADPDIDLIDICTPTHLHPGMAIAALKAGKHVLVEKCIALNTKEADAMVRAAKTSGKLLMVAHVLPFFPEFAFLENVIRTEKYGRLLAAHFVRVISQPDWSGDIGDSGKTGGPAIDLHIHDTHFIGLIAGVPGRVFSNGLANPDGSVQFLSTQYLYGDNGPVITCDSGALAMKGRPFAHGFEVYLEKATLVYHSSSQPLTVFTQDGKSHTPKLAGSGDPIEAFTREIQAAVNGVRDGMEPPLLSGQLARDALVLCHKECQSVLKGKMVLVG